MSRCLPGYYSAWIWLAIGLALVGCQGDPEPSPPAALSPAAAATVFTTAAAPTSTIKPRPTETAAPPSPTPRPSTSPTPNPSPTPSATPAQGLFKPDFGVQAHLHNEDLPTIMSHLSALGAGWVKVQIAWKVFEPAQGRYDAVLIEEVDALVTACEAAGIRVLLGVAKAPEWSRPTTEQDGPPRDPALFADFMEFLADRYAGRVAAYELWNETNLAREWTGVPLRAADFVSQVAAGAAAVRRADPQAFIISGAPAPTGINDGVTAIDDRAYFAQALAAGLAAHVDGFGVHPYGWGNPPDSRMANPASVPSHNNHPSFFFLDTLDDYERILRESGLDPLQQPLLATEFGWGSTDGFGVEPVPGAEFMRYVDEEQQAVYTLRALEIARDRPTVGPMILWNLNIAPTFGTAFAESAYSLLRPDGSPRPAYEALRKAP